MRSLFCLHLLWGLSLLVSACQAAATSTRVATQSITPSLPPVNTTQPAPTATRSPATPTPSITPLPSPTRSATPNTTTLLFTGVIVPARCVQAAIDTRRDPNYLYEEVRLLISRADLAVGTLNATISDHPPRTGCVPTYVLVGGSENADALAWAGFDLMSVASNHIKNCGLSNCGDQAFFDTLDNLRRVGIRPVGAGSNHAEAMQPMVVEVNDVRFGFISLGQLEPLVFASDSVPGIAVLTEENLLAAIAQARQQADVVVVLPHWGPEDVSAPNWSQRELARVAVAAGADLVVGNHTHVVQAVEKIDEVMVFYGLGNFVFDQTWARDHQQGVILQVTFAGKRYTGYELIPTHVDRDGRVHISDETEAAEILERIDQASQALP